MMRIEPIEPDRQSVPDEGAKWHEYASIFPMLDGKAYRDLVEDIRTNGVREPIVFLNGQILDGRNRYCAAREAGVDYPYIEYQGNDPLAYVISLNLKRRHLSESQRAMVAKKLETMPRGRPSGKDANLHVSREQAAATLNVSERSVATAAKVIEQGAPELVAAVEAGRASVSAAAEVATLPKDEQAAVVALGEKEILARAKVIREQQKAERKAKQEEHDRQREEAKAALPDAVQKHQAAKKAAIEARSEARPGGDDRDDRIAELEESVRVLEADNAALKAENKKFGEMRAQWEQGGFEAVIAGKDEQIRVLETRVYRESEDKASWAKSAKFWKEEALKLGYSNDTVIDLQTGEVING